MIHVIETASGRRRIRVQLGEERPALNLGRNLLRAGFTVRYYRLADPVNLGDRERAEGVQLVKKYGTR